ncbi:MAG: fibronectin type III domain-containing protein, partial [Clostridia bacterium]|nr:fibronectin type III domain-containing protein [Clostridia bacterium]
GAATVKVTGKGQYAGTAKAAFSINPKPVSGLKLKAGKGKVTASWEKASGVSGYEIEYAQNKHFKGAKALSVKKTGTKCVLKKLPSKKTWYVRIRCYKTVKGKKYWSDWSSVDKAKTK